MSNQGRTDAWCVEFTAPGVLCESPADFVVIYGPAPDDTFLACEAHVKQEWQPTWEVIPLVPEDRVRFGVPWEKWNQVSHVDEEE